MPRLLDPELGLDQGRFKIRQSVEGHVAVVVGEEDGRAARGGLGPQMDPRAADEPGADTEPTRRVVVPGDHHRGHPEVGEPVQRVVEELDRGQRRHRPVVHVPRHDHRVHVALTHGRDEVTDEPGLGIEHVHPVEGPAEMPVGRVQNPHDPRD